MGKTQGVVAILAFCLVHLGAQAFNLVAQSSVQICPNTGGDLELKCTSKIVVAVTVESNEVGDANPIVLDRVKDDVTGTLKDLKSAMTIKISKTAVNLFYALHYRQDYPSKLIERVFANFDDCHCDLGDKPQSNRPCGVAYYPNGAPIPYSCGKCCSQKRDCAKPHSNTYCRGQPTSSKSKTASCLISTAGQYAAFELDPAKKTFSIDITISGEGFTNTLHLSPDVKTQMDKGGLVLATLAGDFAAYQSDIQFNDKYLVVPIPSDINSPSINGNRVTLEWLMLDRSDFGSEVNKIGTSYEAFFAQPNFCKDSAGFGLGQQILDKVMVDRVNQDLHRELQYSVLRYKNVIGGDQQANGNPKTWNALSFLCDTCGSSVVTMEIAANNVAFLPGVAPGKIIEAHIPDFVALSNQGFASVTLQNIGIIAASFSLSTTCDVGIINPEGLQLSLNPNEQHQYNMSIKTTLAVVNSSHGSFQCIFTLLDSRAAFTDNRTAKFNIASLMRTNGSDGYMQGTAEIIGGATESAKGLFSFGFFDCSKHCVNPQDGTMCYILHLCFKKIMALFASVVTTVVVVIVLLVLWRLGILGGLCRLLMGCCKLCKGRGTRMPRMRKKGIRKGGKRKKDRKKKKKDKKKKEDKKKKKQGKEKHGSNEGEETELPADMEIVTGKVVDVGGKQEQQDGGGNNVQNIVHDVSNKALEQGKEGVKGLGAKMFKGLKGMFKGAKAAATNSPPTDPISPMLDPAIPAPPLSPAPAPAPPGLGQPPPIPLPASAQLATQPPFQIPAAASPVAPGQPLPTAAASAPTQPASAPQIVYLPTPPAPAQPAAQPQILYGSPGSQPQLQAPQGPPQPRFAPPQYAPSQFAPSPAWPPQFAATQPPMRPILPPQGRGFPPGFNPMGGPPPPQSFPPPQFRAPPSGQPQMPPPVAFRPQFPPAPPRPGPQFGPGPTSMQPPQPRPQNFGQPPQQQFGALQGMRPPGGPQRWTASQPAQGMMMPQGMPRPRPQPQPPAPQGGFTFQAGATLAPMTPAMLRPPGARPPGLPPGGPFTRPFDRG